MFGTEANVPNVAWHFLEMGNEEEYIQELELQHTLKELIEVHLSNLGIGYWLSSCLNCTLCGIESDCIEYIEKKTRRSKY